MSRFGYLRDRVFLAAVGAYAINRWLLKPVVVSPFLRGHFNDLLLIPAALPVALWIQRAVKIRPVEAAPSWAEIGLHLVVWSVICEYIGPFWLHRGTADIGDVLAYAAGGIAAGIWWNRRPVGPLPFWK